MSGIRHQYRRLEDHEHNLIADIKEMAEALWNTIDSIPTNRDGAGRSVSLAKTKLEEATMWATHAITAGDNEEHK